MYRNNLGDQIRNIVQDAMDSSNFRNLNTKIQQTVNGALDEVRKAVGPYQSPDNKEAENKEYSKDERLWNRYNQSSSEGRYRYPSKNQGHFRPLNGQKVKEVGAVSGMLLTIFGALGVFGFGLAALICYLVACYTKVFIVLGPVSTGLGMAAAGFLIMLISGRVIRSRVKRFRLYWQLLSNKTYFTIKEAASYLEKSKRFVVKDLKKMIRLGMFPEGHIDDQNTCFILDHKTYEQYVLASKSYETRQKEETKEVVKEKTKQENTKQENKMDSNSELYKAIESGKNYIEQIKRANDAIPGEEISKKLYRLEDVISKIFVCVEKNPEQLQEIRRFMEYYLPTTLKLVEAYREFDDQILQGENVKTAKKEIEDTMDTINSAFEKLLDGLYLDKTMEVSSDISVLQTLLAQEGLTKRDFNI